VPQDRFNDVYHKRGTLTSVFKIHGILRLSTEHPASDKPNQFRYNHGKAQITLGEKTDANIANLENRRADAGTRKNRAF